MQNKHVDETFLEKTITEWQPHDSKPLLKEDTEEIIENTVGFFSLLMDWEKKANE